MIEAKPEEECPGCNVMSTSCAPQDGACPLQNSRMVVNIVVSSFCGSTCVDPAPTCFFGLPEPADKNLDWLLYRYELQKARGAVQGLIRKLRSTSQLVEGDFEGEVPPAGSLGDAIDETLDFLYNCVPQLGGALSV
mgnify:FL=1